MQKRVNDLTKENERLRAAHLDAWKKLSFARGTLADAERSEDDIAETLKKTAGGTVPDGYPGGETKAFILIAEFWHFVEGVALGTGDEPEVERLRQLASESGSTLVLCEAPLSTLGELSTHLEERKQGIHR